MLSFDNVTKSYKLDEKNSISPVREVSLRVKPGELVMIVGRSGTGKTTFLNLAAGLVKPTSGRVLIEDADLEGMTQRQLSTLRSQKLGFIFQFPSLIPALTIMDNVCLPSIFAGKQSLAGSTERAKEAPGPTRTVGQSRGLSEATLRRRDKTCGPGSFAHKSTAPGAGR